MGVKTPSTGLERPDMLDLRVVISIDPDRLDFRDTSVEPARLDLRRAALAADFSRASLIPSTMACFFSGVSTRPSPF